MQLRDHAGLLDILSDRLRSKTPVAIQSESAECGLACLTMISGHYGHRVDLVTMRRRFSTSLKGMSLRDLIGIASEMKLTARALRLDLNNLSRLRLPCILHWNHNHFVVLTRVGRKSITVHDPAIGRRKLSLADVSKSFTGVALEGPDDDDVKAASFSPDAGTVLTTSWDGTARLWPVDPLPIAEARQSRALTRDERQRYQLDIGRE